MAARKSAPYIGGKCGMGKGGVRHTKRNTKGSPVEYSSDEED